MTEAEKQNLIRKLYYNETGFGSPFQIYKEAKTTIPAITLDFIRNYLKTIIERSKPTGVGHKFLCAPRAYHEYQCDVFYITDKMFQKQKYKYGLSCIDIFSKFAAVVPMEERDHDHVVPAILEAFKQIGKQPECQPYLKRLSKLESSPRF